jgi:cytoskeletal protein RodZ
MESMTTENRSGAGDLLRQARLTQRLSIVECAKRTHIAVRYIEGLEDERWSDLPSESHRLGFLKLYARFLGVSVIDILALYGQNKNPTVVHNEASAPKPSTDPAPSTPDKPRSTHWSPSSIPQVAGIAIVLLLLAWVVYHVVSPHVSEQNPMPWIRRRPSHQARLVVPKSSITTQQVNIKAQSDSWLRVSSRNELLFEGILPAGTSKSWSGPGPFQLKIGDVRAITLFWNDQPVDIVLGAHGTINDIRIPPQ